jgi:DNA modification methylase
MLDSSQLDFFSPPPAAVSRHSNAEFFADELRAFREFRTTTREIVTDGVPTFVNEFWTAKQRAAHSLHEISYRACFKPQLPRFFIERLTALGDFVYDPFMGRGTTLIEAALLGRRVAGCDVNPLSAVLTRPRLKPPSQSDVEKRLAQIDFTHGGEIWDELLVFYHPSTLRQITALKNYFLNRDLDAVDDWIRMVAINRLTGHSPGFFSVYTMPPNQAVSLKSQIKINQRRDQTPPERDVSKIIAKKSRQLLGDLTASERASLSLNHSPKLLTGSCASTPALESNSVALAVTSPPFLDIVDYAGDNWLRCWFLGIDPKTIQITTPKKIEIWREAMTAVFRELHRVLRPGGYIAFEVGEVRKGTVRLEEVVLECGADANLKAKLILINDQEFTKTANCWGVDNNTRGTNTNRIVLFQKG